MCLLRRKSTLLFLALVVALQAVAGDPVFARDSQDSKPSSDLAFWEELAFWEAIKHSEDISEYEAYLATYPGGRFARLAELRIKNLREEQEASEASVFSTPPASVPDSNGGSASSVDAGTEETGAGSSVKATAGDTDASASKDLFSDCDLCPLMAMVPAGSFVMGSGNTRAEERPEHEVDIPAPFAIGVREVTQREWMACVREGGCRFEPRVSENDLVPVGNISWKDAQEYVRWLSGKTGAVYRLPSEAEWEYAASGGAATEYWWGDEPGEGRANCKGCGGDWNGQSVAPVGTFAENPFGLYDVCGNLWEWTQDCVNRSYEGAPADGSPWLEGDCLARILRGGSWNLGPEYMRTARRYHYDRDVRYYVHGLRVVRSGGSKDVDEGSAE